MAIFLDVGGRLVRGRPPASTHKDSPAANCGRRATGPDKEHHMSTLTGYTATLVRRIEELLDRDSDDLRHWARSLDAPAGAEYAYAYGTLKELVRGLLRELDEA